MQDFMEIDELILGRYEIVDLLPNGGQASLAKATDQQTGQFVAVKRLSATPAQSNFQEELARFQRAGRMRFGHPAVVDPLECAEEDRQWYTIMPYIEGVNLEQFVAQHGGRLPAEKAIPIIERVAGGLEAIHRHGVVHRDMKPQNIVIDLQGLPHIVDLGICRKMGEATITKGSGLMGSLQWMSPEQVSWPGSEDPRSDLYSLGVILYYILTGLSPVKGDEAGAIAVSICRDIPPKPRQVLGTIPAPLSQTCMKLMAKRPEDRFQTAEAFLKALKGQPSKVGAGGFCTSCGSPAEAGAKFCRYCGAELGVRPRPARCLACGGEAGEASTCPKCRRPFTADHRLLFGTGTLTGMTFRIPEGNYVVGRDALSERDPHISRRHFRVQCLNSSVFVEDAGSTKKTYVAGHPADQLMPLVAGLEFALAGNTATYTAS
ncbi:MAG TPA: protein kinase [Phycisphaerae bacterium]|nr:protein kinase [Phycisphaerae bacterium]